MSKGIKKRPCPSWWFILSSQTSIPHSESIPSSTPATHFVHLLCHCLGHAISTTSFIHHSSPITYHTSSPFIILIHRSSSSCLKTLAYSTQIHPTQGSLDSPTGTSSPSTPKHTLQHPTTCLNSSHPHVMIFSTRSSLTTTTRLTPSSTGAAAQ